MLIFPGWPQVRYDANRIILGEYSANCSLISQNMDMLVCALVKAKFLRNITDDRDGEQGFVHVGEYIYDDSLSTRNYIRRECIRNRYLQGGRSNKPITQMSRPSTDAAPNNIGITKLSIHPGLQ